MVSAEDSDLRRRWSWIKGCEDWTAFDAWCGMWPRKVQVELAAALDHLLAYGPEETTRCADDIYAVYGCCGRKYFWLLVGVALPGKRQLLPLVWSTTKATEQRITDATEEASQKLRKWRDAR